MAIPKNFTAGERLFAADLNDNFEDIDTRVDAVADALDGLETDIDNIPVLAGIGTNVKQVVITTIQRTTSGSFTNIPGLAVNITPSSATSKVLVIFSAGISNGSSDTGAHARLTRNNTAIAIGAASGVRVRSTLSGYEASFANSSFGPVSFTFLDSPGTTGTLTYRGQFRRGAGGTAKIGAGGGSDISNIRIGTIPTSITCIEVAS